jgi:inward rectifier potassium channel
MTPDMSGTLPIDEEPKDLGFGSIVGQEHSKRMLNRDGSLNVRREGMSRVASRSPYHFCLPCRGRSFRDC